jgi:hypothetical protein
VPVAPPRVVEAVVVVEFILFIYEMYIPLIVKK